MAILNRFSAILLSCDSSQFCASHCGNSGDSGPRFWESCDSGFAILCHYGPAASSRHPLETALACLGVRTVVCFNVRRVLRCYVILPPLCMFVCPCPCLGVEERAKSLALSFWGTDFLNVC